MGRSHKRVTLKFDATHQLLDRQKLSASDAQNNGALPPPPRPPPGKGDHGLEGTDHVSEAGQVSVAIPAHMQNKEPHMEPTAALLLTVLRNWISSSPSPPSAMAAQEPVQLPPLAPLHSRY